MPGVVSNNEIKFVKSLSHKKFREENGLFVVEGEKLVSEALASSFTVERVYLRSEVGEDAMARLSSLASPSPVLAVVRIPDREEAVQFPEKGLFLALDGIRDPGNLGTIIRTADWFGIDAVFASEDCVELFNPKVVNASMGAVFRVNHTVVDLPGLCAKARSSGGRIYGTFLDGADIYSVELDSGSDSPSIIVIGNEANGISEAVASEVTDRLHIPSWKKDGQGSESLNAAVAAAVAVAEFRRRS